MGIYSENAKLYLEKNLLTIPLYTKKPFEDKWNVQGFVNENTINKWIQEYPNSNIALLTGEINGLLVIDIDDISYLDRIENFFNIDLSKINCPIVETSRGLHLYFKYPKNKIIQSKNKFLNLFDIKANGGNIVAPPSIHQSGIYYKWSKDETTGQEYSIFNMELPEIPDNLLNIIETDYDKEKFKKEQIIDYITKIIEPENNAIASYDDWIKLGFSISNTLGERGRKYFLRLCWKEREGNKQYDYFLKTSNLNRQNIITIGTLIKYARENFKITIPEELKHKTINNIFWYYDENEKICLNTELYSLFCSDELGYYVYKNENMYKLISENNNIVDLVTPTEILRNTKEYLKDNDEENNFKLLNNLNSKINNTFTEKFYQTVLKEKNMKIQRDKMDEIFIYFTNGFVKVDKYNITFHDYSELAGNIWFSNIKKHDFNYKNWDEVIEKSDWYKFIWNIAGQNLEKHRYLMTLIGYIIHNHNDAGNMRTVILYDEKSTKRESQGRTGKTLFGKSFNFLRNVIVENGKEFNPESQFRWQRISLDTEIIFLNDVSKNFKLENIFNVISDGIVVEKKNRPSFAIPFEATPKLLISTNRILGGEGQSFSGRKYEYEFNNYYTEKFSPKDEFGHVLLDNTWGQDQWDYFYSFNLHCILWYLNLGVVVHKSDTMSHNRIIQTTSEEFFDWIIYKANFCDEWEYDKDTLYKNFIDDNKEDYKFLKKNTFTHWIKILINTLEIKVKERKSNGKQYITFLNIKEKINEVLKNINSNNKEKESIGEK